MNIPIIPPGGILGILGGGQLCMMLAIVARKLGYRVAIWAPKGDNPAMDFANCKIVALFDDGKAFQYMCRIADVITTEWENIPVGLLELFEQAGKLVAPSSYVLAIAQNRFKEKNFARDCKIPITKTLFIKKSERIVYSSGKYNEYLPGILKTNGGGYDGKGQSEVSTVDDLKEMCRYHGCDRVLEKRVEIDYEISVLVARNQTGMHVSPTVVNEHEDGILRTSSLRVGLVPSDIELLAQKYAKNIAEHISLHGILAVEFFVTKRGGLVFNEMAPRPHNSFHASIEAAYRSQFTQHVMAICGLPIGEMVFHSGFKMRNILGGGPNDWLGFVKDSCNLVTLYGKGESRPKRKMGHYVRLQRL